jgi:hypothetical protein
MKGKIVSINTAVVPDKPFTRFFDEMISRLTPDGELTPPTCQGNTHIFKQGAECCECGKTGASG